MTLLESRQTGQTKTDKDRDKDGPREREGGGGKKLRESLATFSVTGVATNLEYGSGCF